MIRKTVKGTIFSRFFIYSALFSTLQLKKVHLQRAAWWAYNMLTTLVKYRQVLHFTHWLFASSNFTIHFSVKCNTETTINRTHFCWFGITSRRNEIVVHCIYWNERHCCYVHRRITGWNLKLKLKLCGNNQTKCRNWIQKLVGIDRYNS